MEDRGPRGGAGQDVAPMNGEKAARERGEASTERENGESASESSSWWENLSDKTRRAAQRAEPLVKRVSEATKKTAANVARYAQETAKAAKRHVSDLDSSAPLRRFTEALNLQRAEVATDEPTQAELEWYSITVAVIDLATGLSYGTFRDFPVDHLPRPARGSDLPDVTPGEVESVQHSGKITFTDGVDDDVQAELLTSLLATRLSPWQQRHAQLLLYKVKELRYIHDEMCGDNASLEVLFWLIWFHLARHVLPTNQELPLWPARNAPGRKAQGAAATPPGQVTVAPGEHPIDPARVAGQGAPQAESAGEDGDRRGFWTDVSSSVRVFGKDVGGALASWGKDIRTAGKELWGQKGGSGQGAGGQGTGGEDVARDAQGPPQGERAEEGRSLGGRLKSGLTVAQREAVELASHFKEGVFSIGRDMTFARNFVHRGGGAHGDWADGAPEAEVEAMRRGITGTEAGTGDEARAGAEAKAGAGDVQETPGGTLERGASADMWSAQGGAHAEREEGMQPVAVHVETPPETPVQSPRQH